MTNAQDEELADFPALTYLQNRRDATVSAALRPRGIKEFIGQERAVQLLKLMTKKGKLSDSVLFAGPPGLGKTTLAQLITAQGAFKPYIGGHLRNAGEIDHLTALIQEGDVIFIDEIHAASKRALELLYTVLEDGTYMRRGSSETLPSFSFIGATTNPGGLAEPLRDRFGQIIYLDYYEPSEILEIIQRSATLLELEISTANAKDIAQRCRGVPRIANRLLKRIKDYDKPVTSDMLKRIWDLLRVDPIGLEYQDLLVLSFLANRSRAVGVETMARGIGLDVVTLQRSIEPYLIRIGLIDIVPGGRALTDEGRRYIGSASKATKMPSLRRGPTKRTSSS